MPATPAYMEHQPRADPVVEPPRDPVLVPLRDGGRAMDLSTQPVSISGHRWGELVVVDLRALVSGLDLGRLFSGNTVFCTDFATVTCLVQVDSMPFEELVVGLVLNAREAVRQSGTVLVRIEHFPERWIAGRCGTGWVMLEVSDSGRRRDTEPLRVPKASGCGLTVRMWLPAVTLR